MTRAPTLLLVASLLSAGCEDFAALKIDQVTATRLRDDRVAVQVLLKSTGTEDWSPQDQYCVDVIWFEPADTTDTGDATGELPEYNPDRDTQLELRSDCFLNHVPARETANHTFVSRGLIPASTDSDPVYITVKLSLGENVQSDTKLFLRGPVTIENP